MGAGLLLAAMLPAGTPLRLRAQRLLLHTTRQRADDLEVGGELAGVPHGQVRYVRWEELARLPLETHVVRDDPNFGRVVTITGVPLARLPEWLGAANGVRMVVAVCDDAYAGHYPAAYLRAHHPLLVLRVNGQPPARWPVGVDGVPMGPYMVSHAGFTPSFQVLAHADEAQVPWGVVRLEFRAEAAVYAPIEPRGAHAQETAVQQGYTIARQSCFRCHARAGEGGLKSSRGWDAVARRAATDPRFFDAYVLDPKQADPASQMAASPQYDAATLAALRAYFSTFVEAGP